MTTDHEKDTSASEAGRFVEAIEKDPAAKRISDFATTPPPKDIQSIKAAADLIEAEEAEEAEAAKEARKSTEAGKQRETSDHG